MSDSFISHLSQCWIFIQSLFFCYFNIILLPRNLSIHFEFQFLPASYAVKRLLICRFALFKSYTFIDFSFILQAALKKGGIGERNNNKKENIANKHWEKFEHKNKSWKVSNYFFISLSFSCLMKNWALWLKTSFDERFSVRPADNKQTNKQSEKSISILRAFRSSFCSDWTRKAHNAPPWTVKFSWKVVGWKNTRMI